jgi:hypothetical protein
MFGSVQTYSMKPLELVQRISNRNRKFLNEAVKSEKETYTVYEKGNLCIVHGSAVNDT